MAQHDQVISDQAGLAFLSDLNNALTAIFSNNSGATAPSVTAPYMWWVDTTAGWLKQRNAADNAWINKMPLADAMSTVGALLFSAADAAAARTALAVLSSAENQTQSAIRFTAAGTGDAITGTLSPAIASYAAGLRVTTTPGGSNTVTGPTLNLNSLGTKTIKKRSTSGSKVALVAGDYNASGPFDLEYDGTDFVLLNPVSAVATSVQLQPISASVGSNALTISASALSLDFRSTTLGSGAVTAVSGTPSNLVISSGSTLGTINATQSRIAVLAINNAGTIELAAVNIAGGNDLSETGLISTTSEGGAGAADSSNVIYSTTARSNVAYRVIGYIESTQATAGTWATAPSTIQGAGGNALTAMSSLGYGQTYQNVLGSRASGTTYYNTTGKPIFVNANSGSSTFTTTATVNGSTAAAMIAGASSYSAVFFVVPPNASYSVTLSGGSFNSWYELR